MKITPNIKCPYNYPLCKCMDCWRHHVTKFMNSINPETKEYIKKVWKEINQNDN